LLTPHEVDLVVGAIPEPATWASLLCGTALLLALRRGRRFTA